MYAGLVSCKREEQSTVVERIWQQYILFSDVKRMSELFSVGTSEFSLFVYCGKPPPEDLPYQMATFHTRQCRFGAGSCVNV